MIRKEGTSEGVEERMDSGFQVSVSGGRFQVKMLECCRERVVK